ncbi:unnamed protein product, partial [Peniophora sp. CBMAI 1063]
MPTSATDMDPDIFRQVMDNLAGGAYDMNAIQSWNGTGGSYNATPTPTSYPAQNLYSATTSAWSPPAQSTSSYSTLNGALSPPASNPVIDPTLMQPQPQQPQAPQQQPQQQYHHTPTPPTTQYTNGFTYSINPTALQQPQPQPSQQLYHNQLQQQQQAQLGLRPQALHSPVQYASPPLQQQQQQQQSVAPRAINPAAFYATPTPPASTPTHATPPAHSPPAQVSLPSNGASNEAKKTAFLEKLNPLLSPRSFAGAASVRALVSAISDYGWTDVEPSTRLEIVNKILAGAGNNYYRAWMENTNAMEIVRDWLRAAAKASLEDDVSATAMPLLTLLDRLPIEKAETLKATKIGGLVRRLHKTKPHDIPAVRDLAQNIERKWCDKLGIGKEDGAQEDVPAVVEGKKRKTPPASAPANGPPAKKAVTVSSLKAAANVLSSKPASATSTKPASSNATAGPSTSRTTVRAVTASGASSTVKTDSKATSKSDSSFFSAPKAKKPLPSFKKAPPAKEAEVAVARPKQGNAFEEALAAMRGQPAVSGAREGSAPVGERGGSAGVGSEGGGGEGLKVIGKRKRKSVTWAPEGRLEMVKFIERAVYDDDGDAQAVGSSCLRDLEKGEGAALHHASGPPFEELVDWVEPSPVDLPPDLHATHATRGAASSEVGAQTAREASALRALYLSAADVPESPGEPAVVYSREDTDRECRTMLPGAEIEALTHDYAQSHPPQPGYPSAPSAQQPSYSQQQQAGASVAELLSSLSGALPPATTSTSSASTSASAPGLPAGVGLGLGLGLGLGAPAAAPDMNISALMGGLDVERVRAALDAATHLAPETKREFYGALDTLAAGPGSQAHQNQPPAGPAGGFGGQAYGGG